MSVKGTVSGRQVVIDKKDITLMFKDWGENEETPRQRERCEVAVLFFNQLTKTEQEECLRIFDEVDADLVKCVNTTVEYRDHTNGFSYVIDNLRIILQLPDDNDKRLNEFTKGSVICSMSICECVGVFSGLT